MSCMLKIVGRLFFPLSSAVDTAAATPREDAFPEVYCEFFDPRWRTVSGPPACTESHDSGCRWSVARPG